MKRLSTFSILFFVFFTLNAQDIHFPSTIIPAGGSNLTNSYINITRWRIGSINQLQLSPIKIENFFDNDYFDDDFFEYLRFIAYPNPVYERLFISCHFKSPAIIRIEIFDVLQRKVYSEPQRLTYPNETIELNFIHLTQALYFVRIVSEDYRLLKSFKISKL